MTLRAHTAFSEAVMWLHNILERQANFRKCMANYRAIVSHTSNFLASQTFSDTPSFTYAELTNRAIFRGLAYFRAPSPLSAHRWSRAPPRQALWPRDLLPVNQSESSFADTLIRLHLSLYQASQSAEHLDKARLTLKFKLAHVLCGHKWLTHNIRVPCFQTDPEKNLKKKYSSAKYIHVFLFFCERGVI